MGISRLRIPKINIGVKLDPLQGIRNSNDPSRTSGMLSDLEKARRCVNLKKQEAATLQLEAISKEFGVSVADLEERGRQWRKEIW